MKCPDCHNGMRPALFYGPDYPCTTPGCAKGEIKHTIETHTSPRYKTAYGKVSSTRPSAQSLRCGLNNAFQSNASVPQNAERLLQEIYPGTAPRGIEDRLCDMPGVSGVRWSNTHHLAIGMDPDSRVDQRQDAIEMARRMLPASVSIQAHGVWRRGGGPLPELDQMAEMVKGKRIPPDSFMAEQVAKAQNTGDALRREMREALQQVWENAERRGWVTKPLDQVLREMQVRRLD